MFRLDDVLVIRPHALGLFQSQPGALESYSGARDQVAILPRMSIGLARPLQGGIVHLSRTFTAIVAPIRSRGGVIGALSVLGPSYRIDDETMHRYGRAVAEESSRLSEQFGAGPRQDQP